MKSLPDFLSFDASAAKITEIDMFNPEYKLCDVISQHISKRIMGCLLLIVGYATLETLSYSGRGRCGRCHEQSLLTW